MNEEYLLGYSETMKSLLESVIELTDDEQEIVNAYLNKVPDVEVARVLGITRKRVRGMRQNIYAKLGFIAIRLHRSVQTGDYKNPLKAA